MHPKIFALALAGSPLLAAPLRVQETDADSRPDILGAVVDTAGQPLEGASVFVYTAAPRRGTSPF